MRVSWLAAAFLAGLSVPQGVAQKSSVQAQGSAHVYVSPELGIAGRTVTAALDEAFSDTYDVTVGPATAGEKRTLKNCRDLLAVGMAKYTAGSSQDDSHLRVLGARCVALDWIQAAKPAAKPSFRHFTFQGISARKLPPQFAVAISRDETEAVRKAAQDGKSILELDPEAKLRARTANKADLRTDDWTALLTVYAHGDFVGDGSEQLLVRWDASVTGGSYTNTAVFLLAHGNNGFVVVREH